VVKDIRDKYETPIIVTLRDIKEEEFLFQVDNKLGVKKVRKEGVNYIVYEVLSIDEARFNTLEDSRGVVMSDYQKYLEATFVKRLREESDISINTSVLNKLVKRYEN